MNLGRAFGLARAATADPTFRARTGLTLTACTVVGLLATADYNRTLDELEQQFLAEQRAIAKAKAEEVRRFMDTFYENLRAMSLIPAVRGIEHRGNRQNADTSAVELGWFAADAAETVQQFYNTLALTVPVSEVYLTLRGYSPHRGEVPFLMYDELVLGGAAVDGAPETQDFPEEAEEEEYDVIEHQIDAFARWYPRFDFPSLHDIPAAMSTSLRTCDNTQYYSRSRHDVHDAFGHVYSVPVYAPGQGPLIGVLSAVFRTNQLEALLVGVPQLVVTEADQEAARAQGWTMPPPRGFALIQAERELVISDRRDPAVHARALGAARGEQRRHSRVQALWPRGVGDDGWELYYEYDSSAYDHRVLDERAYFAQRVAALSLMGLLLIVFFARESQTRGTLAAAVAEAQSAKAQAEIQNQQLRLVLDAVEEGLVVADAEGRVTSECSAAFTRWFGAPAVGEDLAQRLGAFDPALGQSLGVAWEQCADGVLPVELAFDQLPRRSAAHHQRLEFEYRALATDGSFRGALVRVSDVTQREQEMLERQRQHELLSLSTRLLRDRDGLMAFLEEAEEMVECLHDEDALTRGRALHSLKGASAVMGLVGLARECHEAESEAADAGVGIASAHVERVQIAWAELRSAVRALEPPGPRPVPVPTAQLEALVAELRRAGQPALADHAEQWRLEPVENQINRLAEHVQAVCRTLGKQAEVDSRAGAFGLDAAVWRSFWSSLIHVIRNCVDHGLYPPEALPAGHVNRVVLSAERRSGAWVVEVADNGRGIEWEGLRRSLARRGLPCETEAELWEGIFVDGVSSRTTVSTTSGRGVGMAAVRHEVERRGGRVSLVPGVGTTWRFTFPSADAVALAEDEQAIGPGPATNHQAHA